MMSTTMTDNPQLTGVPLMNSTITHNPHLGSNTGTTVSGASPLRRSIAATAWLKLAVIYLLVGISIGIAMGATGNFVLRPVHVHIGLLGWVTMALAGLIYSLHPAAAQSRLATVHFWLHNLALPVMMVALGALLTGYPQAVPALVASEFVLAAGLLAFAVNLFRNLGR